MDSHICCKILYIILSAAFPVVQVVANSISGPIYSIFAQSHQYSDTPPFLQYSMLKSAQIQV